MKSLDKAILNALKELEKSYHNFRRERSAYDLYIAVSPQTFWMDMQDLIGTEYGRIQYNVDNDHNRKRGSFNGINICLSNVLRRGELVLVKPPQGHVITIKI